VRSQHRLQHRRDNVWQDRRPQYSLYGRSKCQGLQAYRQGQRGRSSSCHDRRPVSVPVFYYHPLPSFRSIAPMASHDAASHIRSRRRKKTKTPDFVWLRTQLKEPGTITESTNSGHFSTSWRSAFEALAVGEAAFGFSQTPKADAAISPFPDTQKQPALPWPPQAPSPRSPIRSSTSWSRAVPPWEPLMDPPAGDVVDDLQTKLGGQRNVLEHRHQEPQHLPSTRQSTENPHLCTRSQTRGRI